MNARQSFWPLTPLAVAAAIVLLDRAHSLPTGWWLVPWALSLACFGLPHGAVDHEVILGLHPTTYRRPVAMAVTLTVYLGVCLVVLGGWFLAPRAWFAGFIALTWAHWGLADLWWSWHRDPGYFSGRAHRILFALWRGALPMLVPLAADPDLYRQTAAATCGLFLRHPPDLGWLDLPATRVAALLVTLGLGAAEFAFARRGARTRWLNLAEGASLFIFFSALPALASVGLYFSFWHGLRHIRRLQILEGWTWPRFLWLALPNTLGALALLGALAFFVQPATSDGGALVGVYLALIAALTVPHALVVAVLDTRAGLWDRPGVAGEPTGIHPFTPGTT